MTTLVLFYTSLLAFTFLIFRNAYVMWKINKDFTLPITTIIIYYFTLAGALIFPIDAYTGFKGTVIGLHYVPAFEKLFTVSFDNDYVLACFYYILFILFFQYAFLFITKKIIFKKKIDFNQTFFSPFSLKVKPYLIVVLSLLFISISFYILRNEIYYAIAHEKSIYTVTRATINPYYTLHQLANEFSILVPFIAFTFTILKTNKFNIMTSEKRSTVIILMLSCVLPAIYLSLLGNRREILSGLVICSLICANEFRNIYYSRFIAIFLLVFVLFLGNDFFRSTVIPRKLNELLELKAVDNVEFKKEEFDAKGLASSVFFSNELFYAHFSMYGVLHKHVPLTYGSSFAYLGASLIPRAIIPNRPLDIYNYYALAVKARPGQIYTIHHAAGWYLNFGIIGIIMGAIVLALLFSFAFYVRFHPFKRNNIPLILLKYLAPYLVCSQMVTFISAGPEGYKSMLLEGIIIPIILLTLCMKKTEQFS